MATALENPDGSLTILPTVGEYEHEQTRRANRSADKLAEKFRKFDQKRRKISAMKTLSFDQRNHAAAVGLERMAKRLKREEHPDAEHLQAIAKQAGELLREHSRTKPKPFVDPLDAVIDKAAKELRKTMPACFTRLEDARLFAQRSLPLTEERKKSVLARDAHLRAKRLNTKLLHRFWELVEGQGLRLCHLPQDNLGIDQLVKLGDL